MRNNQSKLKKNRIKNINDDSNAFYSKYVI